MLYSWQLAYTTCTQKVLTKYLQEDIYRGNEQKKLVVE